MSRSTGRRPRSCRRRSCRCGPRSAMSVDRPCRPSSVVDEHLDLHLGHELDLVLRAPERLGLAALAAVALDLADGEAEDAGAASASFTSSSLNGLMMAVTRWAMRISSRRRSRRDRASAARLGADRRRSDPPTGLRRAGRRRVAHALAELHVVGGRAVLVDVDALELAVLASRRFQLPGIALMAEHHERTPTPTTTTMHARLPMICAIELVGAAAVEQALDRGRRCRRRSGVGMPYLPVANSPRLSVPQMPQTPCTGTAPIGSSMRSYSMQSIAERHDDAGDGADDDRARTVTPSNTDAVMATRPPRKPLIDDARRPTSSTAGRRRTRRPGRRRRRPAWCWRRPGRCPRSPCADSVEPGLKPYQPNHRITPPMARDGHVVAGQQAAAVALELAAEAGAEGDGTGEGDHAADGVHHGRAGEVTEHDAVRHDAVEPAHGVAEPAARAPDPVAEDRVDEAATRRCCRGCRP